MLKSSWDSCTMRRPLGWSLISGLGLTMGLALGVAQAQNGAGNVTAAGQFPATASTLRTPLFSDLNASAEAGYSSSTSGAAETATPEMFREAMLGPLPGIGSAMQYSSRRRYGRPRYRGSNTNDDGSQKWSAYVGGGAAIPMTNNSSYLTTSWGIQGGVARNWNKKFGVALEFDYDHFGFTGQTLGNQLALYNEVEEYYDPTGDSDFSSLDGNSHVWSFTLDPTYTFYQGESMGAYVVVGGGFYHKTAVFTTPAAEEYCDYYGFCGEVEANAEVDDYTSNSAGVNGGIGVTYKFSRFSRQRFYAEARLVHTFNSYRPGYTEQNVFTTLYSGSNFFPLNSLDTTYIPVKFGIRF